MSPQPRILVISIPIVFSMGKWSNPGIKSLLLLPYSSSKKHNELLSPEKESNWARKHTVKNDLIYNVGQS